MDAADQALADSGYDRKPFDRTRAGVVVGTEFGGDFAFQLQMALRLPDMGAIVRRLLRGYAVDDQRAAKIEAKFANVLLRHWPALVDESGSFSTSALASRINKTWDLMGGAAAIDAGENSALATLSLARDMLLAGDCDMIVCAAGQRRMGLPAYEGMSLAGMLATRDNAAAPFDGRACGHLPGEGVGVLIVKRLADAQRDGDPIRAIIRSVGAGHAESATESMRLAIERSLAAGRIEPCDISAIEADGFANPRQDTEMLRAIGPVYGRPGRRRPLVLGSVVGQIGHTAGASGMASLLKAALEIDRGEATATVNLREPLPALADAGIVAATEHIPLGATPDGRRLAAVSSCARGLAHHVVLEREAKVPADVVEMAAPKHSADVGVANNGATLQLNAATGTWQICRLGAASAEELASRLAGADATLLWKASQATRFSAADRARLAIVAVDADMLGQKLQMAARQFQNSAATPVLQQQGIFYRQISAQGVSSTVRPRVAMLFAGQGSQYSGMLRQLVQDMPAAAAAMRGFDEIMIREGYPTFAQLAWEANPALGSDIFLTQAAMLLADSITLAALASRGLHPDLVAGHSYGEYVALLAAGAWDFETALHATRARCDAINQSRSAQGTMLAVQAGPAVVEALIARMGRPVYMANHNAPDQIVVGGARDALSELAALAERASHKTRLLAVPAPFHTPLMQEAADRLRTSLAQIEIRRPMVPVLSVATNGYESEPDEIRQNLVAHMTHPVRYVDLIRRITDAGEAVLVEVGPQQVLTGLHRQIVHDRDVAVIASDNPKRPGVEAILGVEALLDCSGALEKEPMETLSQRPTVAPPAAQPPKLVLSFDATARRREKMRRAGTTQPVAARPAAVPVAVLPEAHQQGNGKEQGNGWSTATTEPRPAMAAAPSASEVVTPKTTSDAPASANLESFLINFVVDQTGYPPEVVELDADLEADLGIDSIKKAQLFGELREYFDVTPSENLTLDDFPTLRHVLMFLQGVPIKSEAAVTMDPVAPDAIAATPPPTPVAAAPQMAATATRQSALGVASHDVIDNALVGTDLESFLINFVVEQTGYPPEVVELDADLEADLGIDSIKKAQLFGELREYFDVTPSENLTLDDFPTLRHVLMFLQGVPIKSEAAADVVQAAPDTAITASPPAPVVAAPQMAAPVPDSIGNLPAGTDLETFLIKFVVEQTGYPPEVVELDADLEADLGIDSIKKAQLFGELREYFDVTPSENLTLDDFPTLRHVLMFLQGEPIKTEAAETEPERLAPIPPTPITPATPSQNAPHSVRVFNTTPYAAGLTFGHEHKTAIRQFLRHYADVPQSAVDEAPFAAELQEPAATFDTDSLDELQGIADAAGVPLGAVATMNVTLTAVRRSTANATGQGLDDLAAQSRLIAALHDDIMPLVLNRAGANPQNSSAGSIDTSSAAAEAPCTGAASPAAIEPQPTADDLADNESSISQRFVMRMIDSPFESNCPATPQWQGPALVIGDNPAADALRQRLAASGVRVLTLAISDDLDATLSSLDAIWQQEPFPHVFLMSGRDAVPGNLGDQAVWQRRRYRNVIAPYFLCQRWITRASDAELLNRCTLVATTALGGDFGFSGHVAAPEGGAIAGLIKALCLEMNILRGFNGMLVKAIDAPDAEPADRLAENIVRELGSGTIDYEVAFVDGVRRLQNAIAEPAALAPDAGIRRGSVWVVSGGARGITAACALELGRRFGLKLHLLGTSPLPTIDPSWRNLSEEGLKALKASIMVRGRAAGETPDRAWDRVEKAIETDRALRAYVEADVTAVYHQCDVSNRTALASVLDDIRRSDGPIEGILHGAGVNRATRFERKTRDDVLATIGAKVDGAYHLMTLTRQDPVRYFVGFGSIGGRLGSNGQTDYCLASDMLCKLVAWYRSERPECRSVGFHWHPWDGVGMAARPETRATFHISQGPKLMPMREGIRHLLRELYAGAPRSEVLITDWDYYRRFYVDKKRSSPQGESAARSDSAPIESEAPAESKSSAAPTIAQRRVPRMVDAPLPMSTVADLRIDGAALILGENAAAAALGQRLQAAGASVRFLRSSDNPDTVVAELEQQWSAEPVRHLFILTGRDDDASRWQDAAGWRQRRARGVIVPYLVAQRWLQLVETLPQKQSTTLAAVTALGGAFGLAGDVPAPEGGMLCGMLKSLYVEGCRAPRDGLRLKVVDVPADAAPNELAESVCRELAAGMPEIEVGWSANCRRVVQSIVEPVDSLPRTDLPHGGVWVVTGGARGITAASALALGRRYGLKLHLIGKSPEPRDDAPWRHHDENAMKTLRASIVQAAVAEGRSPEEEWLRIKKDVEIYETLEQFRKAGVRFTYHVCDVSDWIALARTLDDIRRADGPIEGIIHGAGYGRPARFEHKDRGALARTVASKVDGAVALMALTAQDPLRWFVGFGSLSGRFGGNGLSDYAGANDMLAKLIAAFRRRRPDCLAACIHWQTWDEVGMATLADGVAISKNVLQMAFIPPEEGIEHLHQELRAGLPTPEIVITDGHFERTFYPDHETVQRETDASSAETGRPLVESVADGDGGAINVRLLLDPVADPFLSQHRLRGKPFLPAVIGLEAIAEAAAMADPRQMVVALRDVEIVNGLLFHGTKPIAADVTVAPAEAELVCSLTSRQCDRKGRLIDARRPHVHGIAELGSTAAVIEAAPPGRPPLGWTPNQYPEDGLMYHGPALRCLTDCAFQYDGGWGRIVAPPLRDLAGRRAAAGWILPSAVLDACLFACGGFSFFQFGGAIEVPHGFERLTWTRQPRAGETCIVRLYFRGRDEHHSRFDFTVFGDDDRPLLQAIGFRTIRVTAGGE